MGGKCSGCRDGAELPFGLRAAFQPIVDMETGRAFAYEALVRGANGEGAQAVLARVDETNRYAFDQACRVTAIREAVAAGILDTDARLSINFLPNAVYSPMACIQLTLRTAAETGLPTERLVFEFTENQRIEPAHVQAIVQAYRALGFATAIDDFGAGHAGLGLLANLQTDIIKLDMDLVRGIDACLPRRQIVRSMVRLCGEMGLIVVAEGIETLAELDTLRAMGVRYIQGYLLARPALGALPEIRLPDRALAVAA